MLHQRRVVPALLIGAAVALACNGPTAPDGALLLRNRRIWEQRGPENYTLRFQWSCFCPSDSLLITVEQGRVVDVRFADTGEPATAPGFRVTIPDLFELLERAFAQEADDVSVTYHPRLGYPTSAYIDFEFGTADEEIGFRAELLTPP